MKKLTIAFPIILLAFVLFIWGLGWVLITMFIPESVTRGQFGDMFGVVNSLFTGFAFAGVIYTIYLQKIELSLQREELKLTREELKRTADIQEKSEISFEKQSTALVVSARLAALSSLLAYYENQLDHTNKEIRSIATDKVKTYTAEIEKIAMLLDGDRKNNS